MPRSQHPHIGMSSTDAHSAGPMAERVSASFIRVLAEHTEHDASKHDMISPLTLGSEQRQMVFDTEHD